MIKKSIGTLRNLIKKRKQIVEIVKSVIDADDSIIVTHHNNKFSVSGTVSTDAMAVYMLGTVLSSSFKSAKANDPALQIHDYMAQPINVALKHLEREGLIE